MGPDYEPDDPEVDALFDLPAGEFVAARDRLAAERRKAGDRPGADAVKQLRRPTVVAWALNQLARAHADEVDELLELGRRAAAAQQEAMAGDARGLREVDRSRRAAIAGLVDHATDLAGGNRTQLDEIEASIQAAALDPDGAGAQWRAGRLAAAIPPASGFDPALGGWGLVDQAPAPAPRPAKARATAKAKADTADTEDGTDARPTEAERKAEAERARARRKARDDARRTAAQRARAVERAEAALARLEDDLAELEARVAEAREQVGQARDEAGEAEAALAALEADEGAGGS